jgi:tripartite-type tricarboxylate transporter receptor subunit TctC
MVNRAKTSLGLAAVLTIAAAITDANAQWSPSRPVRLIVPFPPGGAVE